MINLLLSLYLGTIRFISNIISITSEMPYSKKNASCLSFKIQNAVMLLGTRPASLTQNHFFQLMKLITP